MSRGANVHGGVGAAKRLAVLLGLALAAVTLAVFAPTAGFDFVNYDDPAYVTENAVVRGGLSWAGVRWALTTGHASNWHPLTWLSHMLDVELHGLWAGGHHLTSVLLHATASLLLYALMVRATGQVVRSALVGGLFALHPLHVESVVWVAERKDVLSATLGLATLHAWLGHTRRPSPGRLLATVLLFALALMAKPMLVTLPLLMLLLDVWPLRRRALAEKLPLFALSGVCSAITLAVQAQAMTGLDRLPLSARVANAVIAAAGYLRRAVWPDRLAVFYPHTGSIDPAALALAIVILAGVTWLAWFQRKGLPHLLAGWLWYLVSLLPVSGLIQVGSQAAADRYTYIPLVGLSVMVVWSLPDLRGAGRVRQIAFAAVLAVAMTACAWRAVGQVRIWRDSGSLMREALRVTSGNWVAHTLLGATLAERGRPVEAEEQFRAAIRANPGYAQAYSRLGNLLLQRGDLAGAGAAFEAMDDLRPDLPESAFNRALAADLLGRPAEALALYSEALRRDPSFPPALNGLAWIRATSPEASLRDGREAVRLAESACRLTAGQDAAYLDTLAAAYAEAGRFEDAVEAARRAVARSCEQDGTDAPSRDYLERLEAYRRGIPHREPPAAAPGASRPGP